MAVASGVTVKFMGVSCGVKVKPYSSGELLEDAAAGAYPKVVAIGSANIVTAVNTRANRRVTLRSVRIISEGSLSIRYLRMNAG